MEAHVDGQQPRHIIQGKETKEDVLSIKEETLSSTQPHQQKATSHAEKPIANNISPSSNLQQPFFNAVINQIVQDNSSFSATASSTTPIQYNQLQQPESESNQNISSSEFGLDDQEGLPESASSDLSLNHGSRQRQTSDAVQGMDSIDIGESSLTPVNKQQITDSTENISELYQQHQIPETPHHISSSDQEKRRSETIQTTNSLAQHKRSAQADQTSQINDTLKPIETRSSNVKSDDISSAEKESLIDAVTSSPATRILRSTKSRIIQSTKLRYRHLRSNPQSIKKQQDPIIKQQEPMANGQESISSQQQPVTKKAESITNPQEQTATQQESITYVQQSIVNQQRTTTQQQPAEENSTIGSNNMQCMNSSIFPF